MKKVWKREIYYVGRFDLYSHGYYKVTERVVEAFKDGLQLKKEYNCRSKIRKNFFVS